jgi:hypothetical protein
MLLYKIMEWIHFSMLNIIITSKAFVVSTNETENGAGRIQSLKENH